MSAIRDTAGRALTARSVVASTLLGVDPPWLPALALVRSGELFGLSGSATRTALSRMAAAGDVEAHDGGYRLAGPLLERHTRQQAARAPQVRPWDGTWLLALVVADGRRPPAERARLREAGRRLRYAEVREGCWSRPDNLDPARAAGEQAVLAAQCTLVRAAVPDDVGAFVAAFEPDRWAEDARALLTDMGAALPALERHDHTALADTFVLNAAVVRHLLADPLLPPELAPPAWPAEELRQAFARFDAGFKDTWRAWYASYHR